MTPSPATPRPHTPLPWMGRQMTAHFAIEAANGVRVAEVNYIGRPDGSTSEDDVDFIVAAVNAYDRLRAEHAEALSALKWYGCHRSECPRRDNPTLGKCTCGLDALLVKMKANK